MAGDYRDYDPMPGPKTPDKYPVPVGENYQQYGEQQGYVYDPYTDTYYPPAEQQQNYYNESGITQPEKKPGISSYLGPIAAGAGAIGVGQLIASPDKWGAAGTAIKEGVGAITSPFSLGGSSAGGATTVAAGGASQAAAAPFSIGTAGLEGASSAYGPAAPNVAGLGAPTAAGVPITAGASAGAAGGSGALGLTGAPWYGAAAIPAGAATGYEQIKGAEHAIKGQDLSLPEQAALALPTFGLSFLANPINKFFGSGKGKEQQARDAIRENLKQQGFLDDQYNIYNADGSAFNIGMDGGAKLPGGGSGGERHYYDVNLDDPSALALIPAADVLSAVLTGGNKKLTSDFTGYFVNAATSSGDPRQNLMSYFDKLGWDHDKLYGAVHEMSLGGGKDGKPLLSKDVADAYKNSLDSWFGVGAYSGGRKPSGPAPSIAAPKPQMAAPSPSPAPQPQASAPAPAAPKPAPAKPRLGSALPTRAQGMRGK